MRALRMICKRTKELWLGTPTPLSSMELIAGTTMPAELLSNLYRLAPKDVALMSTSGLETMHD